jgi:predicted transcriptional regulator
MVELYKMSQNKKCEAYRVEALAAWIDYQATGLHLTAEEADV